MGRDRGGGERGGGGGGDRAVSKAGAAIAGVDLGRRRRPQLEGAAGGELGELGGGRGELLETWRSPASSAAGAASAAGGERGGVASSAGVAVAIAR